MLLLILLNLSHLLAAPVENFCCSREYAQSWKVNLPRSLSFTGNLSHNLAGIQFASNSLVKGFQLVSAALNWRHSNAERSSGNRGLRLWAGWGHKAQGGAAAIWKCSRALAGTRTRGATSSKLATATARVWYSVYDMWEMRVLCALQSWSFRGKPVSVSGFRLRLSGIRFSSSPGFWFSDSPSLLRLC